MWPAPRAQHARTDLEFDSRGATPAVVRGGARWPRGQAEGGPRESAGATMRAPGARVTGALRRAIANAGAPGCGDPAAVTAGVAPKLHTAHWSCARSFGW